MFRPPVRDGLEGQLGYVQPPALGRRAQAELGELHAARALEQVVWKWRAEGDVAQEPLPLDLERVVEVLVVGNVLPVLGEVERVRDVRVPHRLRRVDAIDRKST